MNEATRVAVVTGGMGGLGEAICKRLAGAGLKVVAMHSPANDRVASWLAARRDEGFAFETETVDVASLASCRSAVDAVRARLGPVAVLVNNAGITRDASFRKMTEDDWHSVLRTNLDSMFNMSKQVVEDMLALGWGRIVNISSVNGQRGAFGQANYAASKAGIHGFTKSLAIEFARKNITINTVSPGYLRTRMVEKVPKDVIDSRILPEIPLGRLGEPDEVAQLVAYLASPQAAFITGANISINGGQHMY
jgi:acetoacetyl-CoA reductase